MRQDLVTRRIVRRAHIVGRVDIERDEIERAADRLHVAIFDLGRILALRGQIAVEVAPSMIAVRNMAFSSRVAFRWRRYAPASR
jgi:hypothetical protein